MDILELVVILSPSSLLSKIFFYFLFHDGMALEFIDGTYLLVS